MNNVNRALRNVSKAVEDDRDYRGVGRDASANRKVDARRADRRLQKAILASETSAD